LSPFSYHHQQQQHHQISHFSALAGKHSPILGCVINRVRLGGLIHDSKVPYSWTCSKNYRLLYSYVHIRMQVKSF
jgi:hypothetical protein